jgi:pimeloyl-ACP methyl ester carboxylesterase
MSDQPAPITLTTPIDGLTVVSEMIALPAASTGGEVVLLHGWGGGRRSMQGVAAGLAARGYRVHALDLPGFGDTPPPPEAWGAADYARLVNRYLEAHDLPRVRLVGHSFGGRISMVLGADYPARLEKIVLTSSAGVLPPKTLRDSLVGLGKGALKLPGLNRFEAGLREWAKQTLGSEDYKTAGALEPTFRKIIAEDLLPFAARITAPTLLIWGDGDQDTPLWMAQTLEKTIPDAGLVVFNGAGHFAYQERLPDFLRIVATFFGG